MKLIKQKKEMSTTKRIYGLYGDDDDLMHGVKAFRDKGIEIAEVYTPFPVHGLDKALGLKKTRISDAAFIYACYGVIIGALATWYMMNHDWPQNMMSLTFVIRNKMYPGAPAQNPDPRTTDDKFLIEFVSEDVDTIKQMLIDTGVEEITVKDA